VLLSILGPNRCAACDEPAREGAVFCAGCALVIERIDDERAPFAYGGPIAAAITRFKYRPVPELGRSLGALLASEAPKRRFDDVDCVVPVPLHPTRLFERGFNQAVLLARPVARALGVPLVARALERTRATEKQAELDRTGRQLNVEGAFRARRPLVGRVLLVDDVRTTGATQNACAKTLRAAGCSHVRFWVLAIAGVT
jgi:ComF family protein